MLTLTNLSILGKRCLETFSVVSFSVLSSVVLFFLCKNFKLSEVKSITCASGK